MNVITDNTELSTQIKRSEFFDGALEALSHVAPPGTRIITVGFDNADIFLRAGYRAVERGADVVIVRGGERELEKAQAQARLEAAKLVTCPTHAYHVAASANYRASDGAFARVVTGIKPVAVAFDPADTDASLASAFAELMSLDICAFEHAFAARMSGKRPDAAMTSAVTSLVSRLTERLDGNEKNRASAARIIVAAGRRAARIVEARPLLPRFSGAAQVAEAIRMLYSAEDRPLGMRGETEFLAGVFVVDFYLKNLVEKNGVLFPPDNNRRIDSICEYFKTDVRRACVYVSSIYPPLKMRLCEYRRDEFRSELIRAASELKTRITKAFRVFKRLYADDGYAIRSMLDREDLELCLALAPDVFPADTMLAFLKQTGRLEKYIV